MKRAVNILFFAALAVFVFAFGPQTQQPLAIGESSVALAELVTDIHGKDHYPRSLTKNNGLLVVFIGHNCKEVDAWENRLKDIAGYCEKNNIGVLVLNPNEGARKKQDSFLSMKERYNDKGYNFIYAQDHFGRIAEAFGVKALPEAFLFNNNLQLQYRGALDDNPDPAKVKHAWLMDAINAMIIRKPIATQTTDPAGCSVKY